MISFINKSFRNIQDFYKINLQYLHEPNVVEPNTIIIMITLT